MNELLTNSFTRVFDILGYQLDKYPQAKALNKFVDGEWQGYSISEVQKGLMPCPAGCWKMVIKKEIWLPSSLKWVAPNG